MPAIHSSVILLHYLNTYKKEYERFPGLYGDLLEKFEEVLNSPLEHTDTQLSQLCVRDFLGRAFFVADPLNYRNIRSYVDFREAICSAPDEELFDVFMDKIGPLLEDQEIVKFEVSLELSGRVGQASAKHIDQNRVGERLLAARGLVALAIAEDFRTFACKIAEAHMGIGVNPVSFMALISKGKIDG